MLSASVRLIRTASIVACLIVIASFVVFAVNQTKSASDTQQEALGGPPATNVHSTANSGVPSEGRNAAPATQKPKQENSIHKGLDDVSNDLTSPFSGIVNSNSEWAQRIVRMLLALAVYGFGLGYVARVLRVRV